MPSVAERFIELAKENLRLQEPIDLDADMLEIDISSLDFIAFAKVVQTEFDVKLPSEPLFSTLRELIEHIDAQTT